MGRACHVLVMDDTICILSSKVLQTPYPSVVQDDEVRLNAIPKNASEPQ